MAGGGIRDLRRRFNMDSDRVYLYGWEQGGLMAYDVGLSHPDQFAGVLPQNAGPNYFPLRYWLQAIYLMNASKKGIATRQLQRMFQCSMKTAWHLSHRVREAMKPEKVGPLGARVRPLRPTRPTSAATVATGMPPASAEVAPKRPSC